MAKDSVSNWALNVEEASLGSERLFTLRQLHWILDNLKDQFSEDFLLQPGVAKRLPGGELMVEETAIVQEVVTALGLSLDLARLAAEIDRPKCAGSIQVDVAVEVLPGITRRQLDACFGSNVLRVYLQADDPNHPAAAEKHYFS